METANFSRQFFMGVPGEMGAVTEASDPSGD
jgi:hypothetical protein